jgi:hypothetical protein
MMYEMNIILKAAAGKRSATGLRTTAVINITLTCSSVSSLQIYAGEK